MSEFWKNVRRLLPYKDLDIRELAFRTQISYSTIVNGMNCDSMPRADMALTIASVLDVPLESLLGSEGGIAKDGSLMLASEESSEDMQLLRQYRDVIDALEALPFDVRESIRKLLKRMKDSYTGRLQETPYRHSHPR